MIKNVSDDQTAAADQLNLDYIHFIITFSDVCGYIVSHLSTSDFDVLCKKPQMVNSKFSSLELTFSSCGICLAVTEDYVVIM